MSARLPASPPAPSGEQPSQPAVVPIGQPLRDRAQRLKIIEETRSFRPVIYWYLSFRCNLSCAHCSVQSSPWVDTSRDLTTEECMQVIDQMAELNVRTAILTGGEVLLRPDAVAIIRALGERRIGVGIETNGLRFTSEFIEVAREMQQRRLMSMTISLDGGTQETHERLRGPRSFERTVFGLRYLQESGVRFTIQCVLNSSNIDTIPHLYGLAEELRPACETVQWAILNPVGRGIGLVKELGLGPQHIQKMFALIQKHKSTFSAHTRIKVPPAIVPPRYLQMVLQESGVSCSTTCEFPLLGVLPDGNVSICALSRENESLQFGSIRDPSVRLKSVWEKARLQMLRSRYVSADDLQGICGDCVWKYACKGSCRAWAYEEGDSFDAPFPLCAALEEAGGFPKLYRLSLQNEAVAKRFREMSVGCGCSS